MARVTAGWRARGTSALRGCFLVSHCCVHISLKFSGLNHNNLKLLLTLWAGWAVPLLVSPVKAPAVTFHWMTGLAGTSKVTSLTCQAGKLCCLGCVNMQKADTYTKGFWGLTGFKF